MKKEYIASLRQEKRLIIRHIKDSLGFRYATVVGFRDNDGTIRVGASTVNMREDYNWGRLNNSPYFNNLLTSGPREVRSFFWDNLQTFKDSWVKVPKFKRREGVTQAIKNSRNKTWRTEDPVVQFAIDKMRTSAHLYFRVPELEITVMGTALE